MKTLVSAITLIILLNPTPATAGPDASLQVSKAALDYIGAAIPPHLPKTFVTPYLEQKLVDCGFAGKTRVKIYPAVVNVAIYSLVITPSPGRIKVDVVAGISAKAPTTFQVCVVGSTKCNGNVSIKSARGSVSFSPQLVAGQLRLGAPTVSLDLSHKDTSIWFTGCGVAGHLINGAVSLFKGMIVAKARDALQKTLQNSLPPLLEQSLTGMTKLTETFDNYTVTGELASISSQTAGLTVGANVDVKAVTQAPCVKVAPVAPPASLGNPQLSMGTDHLGLGLSARALGSAVNAAYASGLLCLSQQKLTELGVDTKPFAVGAILLGMHSLTSVDMRASSAPTVKLVPGDGARLALALPLEVDLIGQGPKGPTTITISGTAETEVHLRLDATKKAIMLELKGVTLKNLSATATDPFGLQLAVAKLQALFNIAVAMMTKQLGDVEVAPQSFSAKSGPLSAHYFYLARTTTDADYVYLYGKLMAMPAADKKPPMATFSSDSSVGPGGAVGSGIAVLASDDKTPKSLLRYAWRVDDGDWSTLNSGSTLSPTLNDGAHKISVRVVDLNGNKTESTLDLDVDKTAPSANLTPPKSTTTSSGEIDLSWTLADDRTPAAKVLSKIQVRHVESGVFVLDTDFAADATTAPTVPFTERGDYEVRVFAKDAAGNISDPQMLTITYEGSGEPLPGPGPGPGPGDSSEWDDGCVLAGADASGSGAPTLLLVLVGFIALVARRKRQAN